MKYLWIPLCAAAVLAFLILLTAYVCYRLTFYAPRKPPADPEEYPLPKGETYAPFREKMIEWMRQTRAMPHEDACIRSFDGLTLWGKYYEYAPGAPIELMFHGYRGSAERDLCGGAQRCFVLGRSALIVDQRTSGRSEGNVISFGVNESKDCHAWLQYMLKRFGPDVKIILTGISMGAATVLMAAGEEIPENVIGVLADCGYTSPREIILDVMGKMGLPGKLLYPFVKLGARLYGHFDLEETSPMEAVKRCKVPVIFFHGETDSFVPCDMSRENYAACASRKRLVTIPGAGHGLCYPKAPKTYLRELKEFFGPEASMLQE